MNIIKAIITSVILFFLYGDCFAQISTTLWDIKKVDHFIIYSRGASSEYVDKVARNAERDYIDIAHDLGFSGVNEFWTWDKRIKIYLFDTKLAYQKVMGAPDWSAGSVSFNKREIYAFMDMDNFFDTVLPHELGHIIFREFVGFNKKLPLWLDEGVASYMERTRRHERIILSKMLMRHAEFMTIDILSKMIRGKILMPEIFYAESLSVVDYLLQTFGKDKFVEFCRRIRDLKPGQTWELALRETYKFKGLSDLNSGWEEYLKNMPFTDSTPKLN